MKAQNYNYYIVNIGEKGERAYQAIVPKFPNLHIFLDPVDNMHEIVMETIEEEINDRKKRRRPIPAPDIKKSASFKGKIILRTTPELHEKLYYKAKAHNLSLNKYIEKNLDGEIEVLNGLLDQVDKNKISSPRNQLEDV